VTASSNWLSARYASAVREYLSGAGERALTLAYQIGHEAIIQGLGLLDLAKVHKETLAALALDALPPEERAKRLEMVFDVLAESLSSFEMAQRSFQDANTTLLQLNETLETRAKELAVVNQELETEIQERTRAEEQRAKLEEQLRQAQKMEAIGALAGGIAHDFNNLLNIISAYSSRLSKNLEETERAELNAIDTAVSRGAALVRQLLTFSRKSDSPFESVNLNEVTGELARLLSNTLPKSISLSLDLDPELPQILADSNHLHQAILNLCINARDAMPSGGTLTVRTSTKRRTDLRERFPGGVQERYACVTVSDTGSGIEDSIRARIFEPFFTTKGPKAGDGLGLAVVYGIVRHHGGLIDVQSETRRGATFNLYFPALDRPVTEATTAQIRGEIPGGTETILLVEDEQLLLDAMKETLEEKGYRVLAARDGLEALDVYGRHSDDIDLVLADVGMPRLGGWDAYQRLKEMDWGVKVLLASGHINPDLKAEMERAGVQGFIQKPYSSEVLLAKIREALDGPAAV
jgi:two-component system cell cycle sensor histidine kinase/response regulator CckA